MGCLFEEEIVLVKEVISFIYLHDGGILQKHM